MRKITPVEKETADMPMHTVAHMPEFRIDLKHLPEAKSWKVGETYMIELKLKQTTLSMGKDEYNNYAAFDIIGINVEDEQKSEVKKPRY